MAMRTRYPKFDELDSLFAYQRAIRVTERSTLSRTTGHHTSSNGTQVIQRWIRPHARKQCSQSMIQAGMTRRAVRTPHAPRAMITAHGRSDSFASPQAASPRWRATISGCMPSENRPQGRLDYRAWAPDL